MKIKTEDLPSCAEKWKHKKEGYVVFVVTYSSSFKRVEFRTFTHKVGKDKKPRVRWRGIEGLLKDFVKI